MDKLNQKLLNELEQKVTSFVPNLKYPHDRFIIITLYEAIAAVKEGNFGVGAVLVRENGEIIQRGHNHVFKPYFRSDLHAEMDVMTKFEKCFKDIKNLKGFILYTSFEPCPMCLARLISSGVREIYYAAVDKIGGMVLRLKYMSPIWIELAQRQKFALAQCSAELQDIALQIFLTTANENNRKLQER